ncbi:type II toxin-antitoxin system RatA family toxin [Phocoenobacter skyensis]|uniref:Ribosome association toxin PasT (RatA) of the RatAB toxin-antitoxin module n=1 Tax=Phocoenobacter skyensis TaxID=97481 RepID=A0A1H7U0G3_9PAST|nr:type II toxin-antitoxin system RatA family toxin [Pasteurella skyensis]MDP8078665.1 type II toxin-antitoxin system RatA family toxin [Pasteurella skyensis]MDP8084659.1 type II toxin-antitoxin system RatA family toxin [Pasteurella skyensis]MDP8184195.1 type II toxin-antitoxin system RatA family toxin [Pasteurella skyensis]QLB22850.1 ubiquinone-binding protein [Pasteurella skyensis]SEL89717.1 Ribosome association toxin PasT (RatA) of the RatAB toxin-antitoxin module [Pasteurella skyensis]
MPIINQSTLVPYSAKQMYDLVNDYERYPEFLSGCVGTKTLTTAKNELEAELHIQKLGISQRFSTHNTMIKNQKIEMILLNGPFRYLKGAWTFTSLDEQSCKIALYLEFEFSNPVIAMVFGKVFNELTHKMINSFKKRAKEIYGV